MAFRYTEEQMFIEELFSSPHIKHTTLVCYKMLCKVESVICDSLRIE